MEGNYGLNINTAAFINFNKNNAFIDLLVDRFVEEFSLVMCGGGTDQGCLPAHGRSWNNERGCKAVTPSSTLSKTLSLSNQMA